MRPTLFSSGLCLQITRHKMVSFLSVLCFLSTLWPHSALTSEIGNILPDSSDSPNQTERNSILNLIRLSLKEPVDSSENSTYSPVHQPQDRRRGYDFQIISNASLRTENSSVHFTTFTSALHYNVTVSTPTEPLEILQNYEEVMKTNQKQEYRSSYNSSFPAKKQISIENLRFTPSSENLSTLAKHIQGFRESLKSTQGEPRKLAILDEALKGYDKREWPTYGTDTPTDVRINMYINTLGPVNAANMEFSMDIYLRMEWNDPRLKLEGFGINKVLTLNAAEMAQDIWKPDIFFRNVKQASFHMVTVPNKLIKLSPNGNVLYSLRLTLVLSCQMSFRHYPLDTQQCYVILGPYAQTMDQVKVEWREHDPIMIEEPLELPEFDVTNMSYSHFIREIDTGAFSFLNVTFVLVRQNGFHIIQTYMPTFLLVMISWVSFWLNVDATPARVTLGVTTLLTLTTVAYGVRLQLPPVSYVKAVDVWIGVCSVFVFGALLEFTLVNYLSRSKLKPEQFKSSINIFHWTRKVHMQDMDSGTKPDNQIARNMKRARYVDRFCRIFFPITFFIFNVIYWLYYLYVPDEYLG